jgi:insertion element IS1 protein InsB
VALQRFKKTKNWLSKAVDRTSRRTVGGVVGGRDAATCQRLYDKVNHLIHGIFYTDDGEACAKILPPERHGIGKAHPIMSEQDHSNTRHHLGRLPRRTKGVSKKDERVYAAIKLWCALTQPETFNAFQTSALSIYR